MSGSPGPAIPNPARAGCFRFLNCSYDAQSGIARLSYAFDDGPELVEQITFPHAPWPPEASSQASFRRALEILHLVAGVSYYKAGMSRRIEVSDSRSLDGLHDFLTELYVRGLAEFGYVNQVDVEARIKFPGEQALPDPHAQPAHELILPERALVAMGGGKDSLVGLDIMQRAGVSVMPVCVGGSELIRRTVKEAGLPLIAIGRSLAPELSQMNLAGALNGHVPVTAINSAILLCASILYGFRFIVFANERSADEATLVTADGSEVNHQYSKSSGFEDGFRHVIADQVSPDIEYFSILRPCSELEIVRQFSGMKRFHAVYSSCNRNFHLDGPRLDDRWCGDCPKCRFAALSLAVFMSPEQVRAIQGGDLLDDPGSWRVSGHCAGSVGTNRSSASVKPGKAGPHWRRWLQWTAWKEHAVVTALLPDLQAVSVPDLDSLLQPAGRHFIPQAILSASDLLSRAD